MLEDFDYSFSENGLVAYKDGQPIGHTSINDHLGEDNIKVRGDFGGGGGFGLLVMWMDHVVC